MNNNNLKQPLFDLEFASKVEPLPADYDPLLIEVFDQDGLLLSVVNKTNLTKQTRPFGHQAIYIAWYFDEQLVFFMVDGKEEPLLNRLQLLAINYSNIIANSN